MLSFYNYVYLRYPLCGKVLKVYIKLTNIFSDYIFIKLKVKKVFKISYRLLNFGLFIESNAFYYEIDAYYADSLKSAKSHGLFRNILIKFAKEIRFYTNNLLHCRVM